MQVVTSIKELRKVSRDVTADDHPEKIAALLFRQMDVFLKGRSYVGVAAPQLGYRLRMFVMQYGIERICIVNPVITKAKGKQIG